MTFSWSSSQLNDVMRSRYRQVIVAALGLAACSEGERTRPVAVEIPSYSACLQDYPGNPDVLQASIDLRNPNAILCGLAFSAGMDLNRHDLRLLYRYYRATRCKPEALGAHIRQLDRGELAIRLSAARADSPELTLFDADGRGCPAYDETALDLLMRLKPGEDMRCAPRR